MRKILHHIREEYNAAVKANGRGAPVELKWSRERELRSAHVLHIDIENNLRFSKHLVGIDSFDYSFVIDTFCHCRHIETWEKKYQETT